MPAKSRSQQKLFAMALAYLNGNLKNPPKSVKKLIKSMTKQQIRDFAKTKHKGLPKKKKHKKSELVNYLVKLGNELDNLGLIHLANYTDQILEKMTFNKY